MDTIKNAASAVGDKINVCIDVLREESPANHKRFLPSRRWSVAHQPKLTRKKPKTRATPSVNVSALVSTSWKTKPKKQVMLPRKKRTNKKPCIKSKQSSFRYLTSLVLLFWSSLYCRANQFFLMYSNLWLSKINIEKNKETISLLDQSEATRKNHQIERQAFLLLRRRTPGLSHVTSTWSNQCACTRTRRNASRRRSTSIESLC